MEVVLVLCSYIRRLRKHHGAQRNGLELLDLSSSCRRSLAAMEPTTLICKSIPPTIDKKRQRRFEIFYSVFLCLHKEINASRFSGPEQFSAGAPLISPYFESAIFRRRFDRFRCVDRSRCSKTIENPLAFVYVLRKEIDASGFSGPEQFSAGAPLILLLCAEMIFDVDSIDLDASIDRNAQKIKWSALQVSFFSAELLLGTSSHFFSAPFYLTASPQFFPASGLLSFSFLFFHFFSSPFLSPLSPVRFFRDKFKCALDTREKLVLSIFK